MATESARRRPTRRDGILAAWVLLVFGACLLTWQHHGLNLGVYRLDLDVYRVGAQAWMHNHDLYAKLPDIQNGLNEPFTYPPISAIVMAPLGLASTTAAGVLMTAISVALLVSVIALFFRASNLFRGATSWRMAALLLPLAVLLEPVRTTLAYGQINIVLMALVAFDCLLPSTWFTVRGHRIGWPRGVLTGVAGALKLTPMVFLLYFVARKDWRGAVAVLGGFFGVMLIGAACAPHDSWEYWTSKVFQTDRIGPPVFSGNQSLNGVIYRAHLQNHAATAVWLLLSAVVVLIALKAVLRAVDGGKSVTAIALTACTQLLISPVSWSHHWVWCGPVLLCALVKGRRMWRAGLGSRFFWITVAVSCVFLSEPQVWFPHTQNLELGWALWEQVIGSAYVWVALVTLILYAFLPRPSAPARERVEGPAVADTGSEEARAAPAVPVVTADRR